MMLLIEPLACGYVDDLPEDYRATAQSYSRQRDLILDDGRSLSNLLLKVMSRWSAQLLQCNEVYLASKRERATWGDIFIHNVNNAIHVS